MQVRGGSETPLAPPPAEDPRRERTPWQVVPLLAGALVLVGIGSGRAPAATITTVAGGPGTGPATSVSQRPISVAVWGVFVYVADQDYSVVRRVDTTTGNEIVVAGVGSLGFSGDGGPATAAALYNPTGVALDGAGNLFIADGGNQRIRRVDAGTGTITTVAGNGTYGFSGDGGPATAAQLNAAGVALDGAGNLFIADGGNQRIRRVDAGTGTITTVAGNGTFGFSGDGGPATAAALGTPVGVALDGAGNLFIADYYNYRIRRVDAGTGTITTVAGNGTQGFSGDGGPATAAELDGPQGVALDGAGDLFIAESGNARIRRVDAGTGTITTVAGNGTRGGNGDGGPATAAELYSPVGVALDGAGNVFIADPPNERIRRVDAGTGTITTVAGTGTSEDFSGDGGPATAAQLGAAGVALDGAGNAFIADGFARVRRVDAGTGTITTVAGTGSFGYGGDGGPATAAELEHPVGVALDGAGNLFIAQAGSHDNGERVRRVDAGTGTITTVTGGSVPVGVALDGAGNLFIAEEGERYPDYYYGARIRRVDAATGTITTVAGTGTEGFSGDGGPATAAELRGPTGVALDGTGNLFIADSGNARIRRVDAGTGTITTVAGGGTDLGDGVPATEAAIGAADVALDGAGNLFIADGYASVRRVDAGTGTITTVAGNGTRGFSGDSGPAIAAELNYPMGVALDGAGNLFIADFGNARIREVLFCGDGVVDAGEQCDDGAANGTAASCCASTCTYQLPSTPCSGGSCDGSGVCVAASATTTTATTSTTTTTWTSCGPAPQAGCQPAAAMRASRLLGNGKLSWRWASSARVALNDFGSPPTTTGYLLCVYDRSGLRQGAQMPAGRRCGRRPCWKRLGAVGFKYGDEAGTPDGLTRALLEAGGAGRGKIRVKGWGANLRAPALPLTTPVRVQLRRSDGSTCWEATYSTAIRNDATGFRAKSDH